MFPYPLNQTVLIPSKYILPLICSGTPLIPSSNVPLENMVGHMGSVNKESKLVDFRCRNCISRSYHSSSFQKHSNILIKSYFLFNQAVLPTFGKCNTFLQAQE